MIGFMFASNLVNYFLGKIPQNSWLSVILGRQGIVGLERYRNVSKFVSTLNCKTVLDVGSNEWHQLADSTVCVDIKRNAGVTVVADASALPCSDYSFDCVTAVDVIEHITQEKRKKMIDELKRCGKTVLVHAPFDGNSMFLGKHGDLEFFQYLKNSHNLVDENTRQHIECGQPKICELNKQGFKVVKPDWNLNVWFTLMKCRYVYYVFTGSVIAVLYFLVLSKVNNPPFYGAYMVYDADNNGNS